MMRFYSEAEVVTSVSGLTPARLVTLVEAEIVLPVQGDQGRLYRQIDVARLQLLADLAEQFELSDDGLAIVMRLIDQLHTVRSDMRALLTALADEPVEVRARLSSALQGGKT